MLYNITILTHHPTLQMSSTPKLVERNKNKLLAEGSCDRITYINCTRVIYKTVRAKDNTLA